MALPGADPVTLPPNPQARNPQKPPQGRGPRSARRRPAADPARGGTTQPLQRLVGAPIPKDKYVSRTAKPIPAAAQRAAANGAKTPVQGGKWSPGYSWYNYYALFPVLPNNVRKGIEEEIRETETRWNGSSPYNQGGRFLTKDRMGKPLPGGK